MNRRYTLASEAVAALIILGVLAAGCNTPAPPARDVYAPLIARQPTPTTTKPAPAISPVASPTLFRFETFLGPLFAPPATVTPTPTPDEFHFPFFATGGTNTPTLTAIVPHSTSDEHVRLPIVVSGATQTPTQPPTTPTSTPAPTVMTIHGRVTVYDNGPLERPREIRVVVYTMRTIGFTDWWSFYAVRPQSSHSIAIRDSGNLWRGGFLVALMSPDQWIEAQCLDPAHTVGVQFWGDENDGWARILVDGQEQWVGNTYGVAGNLFVRYVEISGFPADLHVVRVEALGRRGVDLPGGNDDVAIYAFVCGLASKADVHLPSVRKIR